MTDTYGDLSDRELLDKVKASGNVIYLDESKGLPVGSVWDDINPINSQAKESLGYPTQKPLPLLERILKTSSNDNDIVLDAFCGCGTALVAAQI
jgi:site-specific DNA-methyltransferase (adenine-specific)